MHSAPADQGYRYDMTGVAETFDDATGLVCAYVLDGTGGGRPVGWDDIEAWTADHGPLWVHLDRTAETGQAWLRGKSGLDPLVVEALLAEETRPRSLSLQGGLLVILRGVNLNPGADPEDMISVRIWVEECRVISTRARRLMAVHDLRERLAAARGPNGPGDFLVLIAGRLIERMGPVIEGLDEAIDALEEELLTHESRDIRHRLGAIRRQAIALRRYLAPQREAMARLQTEEHAWLSVRHKAALRETTDRVIRRTWTPCANALPWSRMS